MLAVIIGATNGVGYYTALGLAKQNVDSLILLGRSDDKLQSIKQACLDVNPSCKLHLIVADLALISNIRVAVKQIQEIAVDGIDILYNSAALCLFTHVQTTEGIEQSFVVNYLQRFLVINELLPLLYKIPNSRILIVAGPGQNRELLPLDMDDLAKTQSKNQGSLVLRVPILCNCIFVSELERKLKKENSSTTICYYNPGLVNTGGQRDMGWMRHIITVVAALFGRPLKECGDFPVKMALDEAFKGKNVIYFKDKMVEQPELITNEQVGTQLWNVSVSLCDKVK